MPWQCDRTLLTHCVHPCMHYFGNHTQYIHKTVKRAFFDNSKEGDFLSINVILPTNNVSGTLPSWRVLLITLVSMVKKQGQAYLSMATETLSTPGPLCSFIFSSTSLIGGLLTYLVFMDCAVYCVFHPFLPPY